MNAQVDWDEELYWQIGRGWTEGRLPYLDIFDHKPPLVYVLQLLYSAFTGSFAVFRATSTAVLVASAFLFGRSLWPCRPQTAAMFVLALMLSVSAFDGIGTNSELLYLPYVLLTGALLLRPMPLSAALAGAVAVNLKYTVVLDVAGVVAFVVLARGLSRRSLLRFCAASVLSASGLWFAFWLYFWFQGIDLLDTTVVANFGHAAFNRASMWALFDSITAAKFGLVMAIALLWSALSGGSVDRRLRWGAIVWAALALAAALTTGKIYYHYAIPVYAPISLWVAAHFCQSARRWWRWSTVALAVALSMVVLFAAGSRLAEYRRQEAALADSLCDAVRGRSVYVAAKFIAAYRICDLPVSKFMFPPFLFRPHFVELSGSRGLDELRDFEIVLVSPGSQFESALRSVRTDGIFEL